MWINALIASAGGQIVDQDGDVKVDDSAKKAAGDRWASWPTPTRPPAGMSTNAEDQARSGRSSRAARPPGELPVRLSEREGERAGKDFQKNMGGASTRVDRKDKPSRPPLGGINIGVSTYSEHRDLAFQAAECLVQPKHQAIAAERAACRRRASGLRHARHQEGVSGFADLIRSRSRTPRRVRESPAYQRHLAGDPGDLHPPTASTRTIRATTSCATGWRRRSKGRSSDGGSAPPRRLRGRPRRRREERRPSAPGPSASWRGCCARRR